MAMVRPTETKINKYKCVRCDLLDTNCPLAVTSDDTHIVSERKETALTEFAYVFVEVADVVIADEFICGMAHWRTM